jgi:hypothetical protein
MVRVVDSGRVARQQLLLTIERALAYQRYVKRLMAVSTATLRTHRVTARRLQARARRRGRA